VKKVILFVGGPFAGDTMEWPEPLPPVIRRMVPTRLDPMEMAMCMDLDVVPTRGPEVAEYRKGIGGTRKIAGSDVQGYFFTGDDKYGRARTHEKVVGFEAPHSLTELDDKTSVEWLLHSTLGGGGRSGRGR